MRKAWKVAKKKNTDHVKVENTPEGKYRMFCAHCGRDYIPGLPMSLDMFPAIAKQFIKEHRDCPEPVVEEK